jgi:hypothetical protein
MQSVWILREVETEEDIMKEDSRPPKQTQVLYRKDGSVDVVNHERIDRLTPAQAQKLAPFFRVPTKGYDALLQAQMQPPVPTELLPVDLRTKVHDEHLKAKLPPHDKDR